MRFREIKEEAYQNTYRNINLGQPLEDQIDKKYYDIIEKYFKDGKFIFRGMKRTGDIVFGDGNKLERKSANTTNEYTTLLDVLPSWRDFPKRSKSFICSSTESGADGYGSIYYVIPIENQPIAMTSTVDFWMAFSHMREKTYMGYLPDFNIYFRRILKRIGIEEEMNTENINGYLDIIQDNLDALSNLKLYEETIELIKYFEKYGVKKALDDLFSPEKNEIELFKNFNEYPSSIDKTREVWLSSKVIFVNSLVAESYFL